jgi:hypothetical protein
MFKHLSTRQEMEGPEDAFRFKSIQTGHKIAQAQYPRIVIDADADADARPRTMRIGPPAMVQDAIERRRQLNSINNPASPQLPQISPANDADADDTGHDHYNVAGTIDRGKCDGRTFVKVDHATMIKFQHFGIAMPIPCNGPSEGDPLYDVPCHIYKQFIQHEDNNFPDHHTNQIDPLLLVSTTMPMPTPNPTPAPTPTTIRISRKAKDKALLKIVSRDTQTRRRHAK